MKWHHLLFLLLFNLLACQGNDNSTDLIETGLLTGNSISINDIEREYVLFIPENQNNSPLVILLHGNGDNAERLIGEADDSAAPYRIWKEIASANNLILAIPNGTIGPTEDRGWNDCRSDAPSNPASDDTTFINSLIDRISTNYSIDLSRVYVNGTSNGGHMAFRLIQEIPERIAAIAAIVATMPENSECTASQEPISVLLMNGTDDPISPYGGGDIVQDRGSVLSTDATVDYWISRNQTDTTPFTTSLENINQEDNSTVDKFLYSEGLNDTEVVLFRINNGGHTAPSIAERYSEFFKAIVGEQNGDIEMARETWLFFEDKSKID